MRKTTAEMVVEAADGREHKCALCGKTIPPKVKRVVRGDIHECVDCRKWMNSSCREWVFRPCRDTGECKGGDCEKECFRESLSDRVCHRHMLMGDESCPFRLDSFWGFENGHWRVPAYPKNCWKINATLREQSDRLSLEGEEVPYDKAVALMRKGEWV